LLPVELGAISIAEIKGGDDRVGHMGHLATHVARLPPLSGVVKDLEDITKGY